MFSFFALLIGLPLAGVSSLAMCKPVMNGELSSNIVARCALFSILTGFFMSFMYLDVIGTRKISLTNAEVLSKEETCDFFCLNKTIKVTMQMQNQRLYAAKLKNSPPVFKGDRITGVIEKDLLGIVDKLSYIPSLKEISVSNEQGKSASNETFNNGDD